MLRHSWYVSPELATLALFSDQLTAALKASLVKNMIQEQGPRLVKSFSSCFADLQESQSFFATIGLDDSFLQEPVSNLSSYQIVEGVAKNIPCVNDCAACGVALIQEFNSFTKDEVQKQFMLQVIEKHRKDFKTCTREALFHI